MRHIFMHHIYTNQGQGSRIIDMCIIYTCIRFKDQSHKYMHHTNHHHTYMHQGQGSRIINMCIFFYPYPNKDFLSLLMMMLYKMTFQCSFVPKFCSSSSLKCTLITDHTYTTSKSPLPFKRDGFIGAILLIFGPDLLTVCSWVLLYLFCNPISCLFDFMHVG